MGLTMKEKQAVTREYKGRYLKAAKKEKRALLDQFIRFTGNHRKSAIRLLSPQTGQGSPGLLRRETAPGNAGDAGSACGEFHSQGGYQGWFRFIA